MKRLLPEVLVLWSREGDEVFAVTQAVQARQRGKRVKLVGLDNRHLRGSGGVQIMPDLTLSEALPLAPTVSCIILSMEPARLLHYLHDPRLITLLQNAIDHRATLVTQHPSTAAVSAQLAQLLQRDVGKVLQIVGEGDQHLNRG